MSNQPRQSWKVILIITFILNLVVLYSSSKRLDGPTVNDMSITPLDDDNLYSEIVTYRFIFIWNSTSNRFEGNCTVPIEEGNYTEGNIITLPPFIFDLTNKTQGGG